MVTTPTGVGIGWFQSSPGPRAGRCKRKGGRSYGAGSFQSSPGPRAGRCRRGRRRRPRRRLVSILARPEGRALRCRQRGGSNGRPRFNPRPARGPGAASRPCRSRRASRRFNPRPARGPGAASVEGRVGDEPHEVSILARPEGRALPGLDYGVGDIRSTFQSSPGPRAGRCRAGVPAPQPDPRVSILARPEGRALPPPATTRRGTRPSRFNPRPARGPGAAVEAHAVAAGHGLVSILARPEGRALPGGDVEGVGLELVSILARPEGRALPHIDCRTAHPTNTFQSSPGPRAGRCRWLCGWLCGMS